jgi:hypothetical protein
LLRRLVLINWLHFAFLMPLERRWWQTILRRLPNKFVMTRSGFELKCYSPFQNHLG